MLDPKYIPLFIGGFIAWICFMIFVGWITSRGKNEGSSFLTGGGNLGFFLIFCTVGATMIGTGSSMGAIGNGFNHGWGGAIYGLGASAGILSMLLFTKAKNKGFLTMSEEAQYYYGGKKIIRQVNRNGVTVLLVEQNAKMALEIANRAYVLETGTIKMEGEATELANNIEVRKAYLGCE